MFQLPQKKEAPGAFDGYFVGLWVQSLSSGVFFPSLNEAPVSNTEKPVGKVESLTQILNSLNEIERVVLIGSTAPEWKQNKTSEEIAKARVATYRLIDLLPK